MKKQIVLSTLVAVSIVSLIGCGGSGNRGSDGSSTTGTGYYVDSAVSGVDYICGSQNGSTGDDGKFTFEKGKDCTFSLAGIKLRETKADELSDKVKIVEDDVTVARFLQSIDFDGNASNGIQIKKEVLTALEQTVKEMKLKEIPKDDDNLTNIVNDLKNSVKVSDFKPEVKPVEEVEKHIQKTQDSVLKELLVGKTYYLPVVGGSGDSQGNEINDNHVETLKFELDGHTLTDTWKNADGMSVTLQHNYSINNGILNINGIDGDGEQFDININTLTVHRDYISFSGDEDGRFYFSKSKAEASYDSVDGGGSAASNSSDNTNSSVAVTQDMLANKVFYFHVVDKDGESEYMRFAFDPNDSVIHAKIVASDNSSQDSIDMRYELKDGKIIRMDGEKNETLVVLKVEDDAWIVKKEGQYNQPLPWYTAKPQDYPAEL